MIDQIKQIIDDAERIVIIQADNPDADSLGSALALEQILGSMGKSVYLYCGVETPTYLRYLEGWSRINQELPSNFDASIVVDASTMTLLEKLSNSGQMGWLATRPCIVLDHHGTTDNSIEFATIVVNEPDRSSTGELIYDLSKRLGWQVDVTAGEYVMTCILGDTQGLTNELTTSRTYQLMSELTELGVNRPMLEEKRRESSKMDPKIFKYKAELINRTEFYADGKLAIVSVPQAEINEYSPLYNPAPLIQNDMLMTSGVLVSVVLKHYDDGKVLAAVRCNVAAPVGALLATHFGGGGHPYAAGFKINDKRPFNEVKSECISKATELLQKNGEES
jgi:bifunctional oligoribonuclease and PAP phosphatase NrnA